MVFLLEGGGLLEDGGLLFQPTSRRGHYWRGGAYSSSSGGAYQRFYGNNGFSAMAETMANSKFYFDRATVIHWVTVVTKSLTSVACVAVRC